MSPTLTAKSDSGAHQRRLGKYTLLESLPVYGMVQPHVARADGEIELVVVKRLLMELASDPVAQGRFEREARVAAALRHENLVRALDSGTDGDVSYLVTEWVRGVSLFAVLDRLRGLKKRMPAPAFVAIAQSVLSGLGYAHRATDGQGMPLGIVHRDLAPRSIVLSFSGEVKVADFGVARAHVTDFKTLPGTAVGSVPYMSPEQAHGQPLDPRSDIYALGALFYELLTNRPVVVQGSMLGMLRAVVSEEPRPLASLRPDLPPPMVQAVQRALAKDPAERWPDAESFAQALSGPGPAQDTRPLLSQFVRRLLPERETEMAELMGLIRDTAEQGRMHRSSSVTAGDPVVPSDLDALPQRELATQVLSRRSSGLQEPPEPSVMTMPGALASPQPAPISVESTPRRVGWVVVAVLGVFALGLGVSAWWMMSQDDAATIPLVTSSSVAEPQVLAAKRPTVQAAPLPKVRVPRRAAAKTVRAKAKAPVAARDRIPAPAAPVRTPAPAIEAPADPRAAQLAALKRRVRGLKANPRDPVKFQSLHRELDKLAAELPPEAARKVRAKLAAAERTYDAYLLGEALDKIIQVVRLRSR